MRAGRPRSRVGFIPWYGRNEQRPMVARRFDNLLNEFGRLPPCPDRQPTFMEIAGCAHKESVCNNILAFFFDPEKPHGLGTLFLDALARTGGIQNQETIAGNVKVDREEQTDAGKRIDLLIQSDSHAILIENKIFAGVHNPLGDYAKHLDCLKPTARHKHKFLLTLTPSGEEASHGFQNITHQQLVKEIRGLLGSYVDDADIRYLTFMLDFLNALDNLQGGVLMDPEFLGFLRSHRNDVEKFLVRIRTFKQELRKKVEELAKRIDVGSYSNVERSFWGKQFWGQKHTGSLFDILAHDISLTSGLVVAVDTVVTTSGWSSAEIFVRRGGKQSELQNLLQRLEIPIQKIDGKRLIHPTHFDIAADLDRIAAVVQDVVRKLADSDGVA